ncbi:MAG: dephospho-CoA kinase [Emergencia sp.]|nr:dephospho-CoA kinase [Emergencia sp.]
MKTMKIIGLTGGIGAGKSTVTEILIKEGYPVIDADRISRKITEKGSPVLEKIAGVFGNDMILPGGELDRKKLASLVFSDSEKRLRLEEITTKEVVRIISEKLDRMKSRGQTGPVFVDAPLLFESGADRLTDLVWTVDADISVRVERVCARDGATPQEVRDRIDAQMSSRRRAERSAEVIDNSKGKEELCRQVKELLKKYAETE